MDNNEILQTPVIPGQQKETKVENKPVENTVSPKTENKVNLGFDFSGLMDGSVDATLTSSDEKKPRARRERSLPAQAPVAIAVAADQDSSIYSYSQTTNMLHDTLQQIDSLACELKEEFDTIRHNRTLKNKGMLMSSLAENVTDLLNAKVSAIKEINNCINKANDLDYKREKDRKSSEVVMDDDKHIMDMYNSFIRNPMTGDNMNLLGPTPINTTVNSINGESIMRSPIVSAAQKAGMDAEGPVDIGYLNYINRLTPEQNMMFYENDPNVKTVVVFDAQTGNKFFQVMNIATGQVIPNVPVLDNRFMEDTTLDVANKIAKNNNLHQTYPLIIINEGSTNQY